MVDAIMMLLVSATWHFTGRSGQFTEKQENNEERRLLGPIEHSTGNGTLPGYQNQVGSEDFPRFTKSFSIKNKLGGSGFGCMYKGQLASDDELIAAKRLTRSVASVGKWGTTTQFRIHRVCSSNLSNVISQVET